MNTTTEHPAANGEHTTNGLPHGSTSITPHIVVRDASKAIDFYRDVFGARVLDVTRFPGGDGVAHAVLDFGTGMLTLSDPIEQYGLVVADDPERRDYSLAVYVTDCDAVTDAAASAGATVREQPTTFVNGDRYSSVLDPFGVRWSVMTRVEDLSFEESAARVAEWAASQGSAG
ncbi:VOC family protein [Humibacter ginsenosidimutans]|uniref:VOC family protein n=1 Tax=Humibacter ginsenosidimutans TaxID=2599293 RepID=A0A5B8M5K8_9MICO|nr:VOC family protein [Humibacter ginsenosidimutans]QDZ15359.1 VOC family protein [Humibacter ginsenosidimutans]